MIKPQKAVPNNSIILDLAKTIHIRSLQMRAMLIDGCALYLEKEKMDELKMKFDTDNICYKIIEPEDPRDKYPYYMHCHYPYSGMRKYLPENQQYLSDKKETSEKCAEAETINLDRIYEILCEYIPENKALCEEYVSDYGLDHYPFAFICIFQPMVEAYRQKNMDLFGRYSQFVEYVMDHGEQFIAQAVGDEVVDRLEFDEPSDVWNTFRNYASKAFHY